MHRDHHRGRPLSLFTANHRDHGQSNSSFKFDPQRPFSHTTTDTTNTTTIGDEHPIKTIPSKEMNLFTAINDALHIAMQTNESTIVLGEDVAFGGVFRCTQNLQATFGRDRVFNTPLSEVGILGMALGYTATSHDSIAIAELQFADYIFPALDQICNEVAKFRYRSGNQWDCAGLTVRTPYGSVGHGGHYHSQSPESYLCHTAGLTVVVPRSPVTAKGLLLSSIRSPDPVIFLEPKALYRTAVEAVPIHDYELPLSQAEVIRTGTDITLIGWGQQLRMIESAADLAQQTHGVSCEVIDVQTLVPCDYDTLIRSVQKTGKCIISHEAPMTLGTSVPTFLILLDGDIHRHWSHQFSSYNPLVSNDSCTICDMIALRVCVCWDNNKYRIRC